jgi:hypothetical protein
VKLTESDIDAMISKPENEVFDLEESLDLDYPKTRFELAKDLCCFANSQGGYFIIFRSFYVPSVFIALIISSLILSHIPHQRPIIFKTMIPHKTQRRTGFSFGAMLGLFVWAIEKRILSYEPAPLVGVLAHT